MSIYFIYIPSPIIEVEVLYTSPRDTKTRPLRPPNYRETGTFKTKPLQPPNCKEVGLGLNSTVNWHMGEPICLTGTIGLLSLFICSVTIGGIRVGNNYKGIKLTAQAHYKR